MYDITHSLLFSRSPSSHQDHRSARLVGAAEPPAGGGSEAAAGTAAPADCRPQGGPGGIPSQPPGVGGPADAGAAQVTDEGHVGGQ